MVPRSWGEKHETSRVAVLSRRGRRGSSTDPIPGNNNSSAVTVIAGGGNPGAETVPMLNLIALMLTLLGLGGCFVMKRH